MKGVKARNKKGTVKITSGKIIAQNTIPPREPRTVSLIALYPLPSRSILWPGITESSFPLSGAPKSMDGMKLTMLLVTASATTKDKNRNGYRLSEIKSGIRRTSMLGCIPGKSPKTIPNKVPMKRNRMISRNIFKLGNRSIYLC